MEKQVWVEKYGSLYLVNKQRKPFLELKNEVYELMYNDMLGFSVRPVSENFDFDYKIYGLETNLINRVLTYYKNTQSGNLGVLLNGLRGTGKTVTSKIICNNLQKPVILVTSAYNGAEDFLNSIPQDIVIFIDEYEKIYKETHEFLTIMDGALNSEFRRVFLLTTNNLYIDQNLLDRPSRIRYLQTFNNLTPDIVEEIVDDILLYPEHKDDIVKYVSTLEIITVDIVKAIIGEVNIHNESPSAFKSVFNVSVKKGKYKIFVVTKGVSKLLVKGAKINTRTPFGDCTLGNGLYANEEYIGRVTEVIDYKTIKVKLPEYTEDEDDSEDDGEVMEVRTPAYNLPNGGEVILRIEDDYVYNDTYMYGSVTDYEGVIEGWD